MDISVNNTRLVSHHRSAPLKLSGHNRRGFAVIANNVYADSISVDGQKPTVGWETPDNFDFGIRVGDGVDKQLEIFRATNGIMKDIGLDGIYLANVNNAVIENYDFINCRRAGIAIVSGKYGTTNITIRNCRFFCNFAGGPPGKERPLFAIDVEPDFSDVDTKNILLHDLYVHQGRLSMVGTPPATIIGGIIRNCDIVGLHGELAIDACSPQVSNVNLFDGAYAIIDSTADSFPAQPYISNLRCTGRAQKYNDDGRANLLPNDYITVINGSLSQGGTGSHSDSAQTLDGIDVTVSVFQLRTGSGFSSTQIPTTATIAPGDNVWIVLEVSRNDGNDNDEPCVRVALGATIDRTYSLSQGRQWIVIAHKATEADSNPSFRFGLSGSVSANVAVCALHAFFYINPALVDMPSMKVVRAKF